LEAVATTRSSKEIEEAHRVSGRKRSLGWALMHSTVHQWAIEHAA